MIAPEPVSAAMPSGAERQPRTPAAAASRTAASGPTSRDDASAALREQIAELLPPLPPPPDPPGTAYVAAVLSGALSPRPVTPHDVYQRTGEWTPPESSLHLADMTI